MELIKSKESEMNNDEFVRKYVSVQNLGNLLKKNERFEKYSRQ